MTPNKRDLKAYSRFDGTGRIVPGSTVLRRQKPKNGKWIEVQTYECCNVDQLPVFVNIGSSFPIAAASITIDPDNGNFYHRIFSYTNETAADINALTILLNNSFPNLGTFKLTDGDLFWTPSIQIAEFYQKNNTTVLLATVFND